ncbi:MAG: hypothetical protein WB392_03625 [Methanotrichaceae archaeon]
MQKIGIVIVLAAALFVVPALVLADENHANGGAFRSDSTELSIPDMTNVNFDGVTTGSDSALAFGPEWGFKSSIPPKAENNLEIMKNQQSGMSGTNTTSPGQIGYGAYNITNPTINIEQIKLGNRQALAFGSAIATNNIKIDAVQNGVSI